MIPELLAVEVEINSRCNRRCSYCPVSVLTTPEVQYMELSHFRHLLTELAGIQYSGRLSFHLYNEPLLHRGLEEFTALAREMIPAASPVLFTNGDLLDDRRYRSLMAAGMALIVVTVHSGGAYPTRIRQVVQYAEELVLTNRGGLLEHIPPPVPGILTLPCYAPSEMLVVSIAGDVLLCYEDAERSQIMGNILRTPLPEIWYSDRFASLRAQLRDGRSGAPAICARCNNAAHVRRGISHRSEAFWDILDPASAS
jgi:cyclic pyranopterin phosphate synthase